MDSNIEFLIKLHKQWIAEEHQILQNLAWTIKEDREYLAELRHRKKLSENRILNSIKRIAELESELITNAKKED